MSSRLPRRRVLHLAALSLAAPLLARPARAADGLTERTIETGQGARHYLEFVPDSARSGAPVLFALHGGEGSMRRQFAAGAGATRDWPALALREGFILIAPNGTNDRLGGPAGDRQHWNDLRDTRVRGIDDVGFLTALAARVVADHGADARRIYATGPSNGGMMTYRLLTEAADVFAAGVAFVANLPRADTPRPARPVPVMIMNGTADPLMPYGGGTVAKDRGAVLSTDETARFFAAANGITGEPRRRALPDPLDDGCRMIETRWPGPAPVVLVTVEGGGHQIPHPEGGTSRPLARRIVGPACRDAHGLEIGWRFLRGFRR